MVKKIFVYSLLSIFFLLSIVSAASQSCSPDDGYKYCYTNKYTYGTANSYAKIQVSDVLGGTMKGGYFVGTPYMNILAQGDKIYQYKNLASWSSVKCDEVGCNGNTIANTFRFNLASIGQQYTDCPAFVAWDTDVAQSGDYAWTYTGTGWIATGNCFNVKAVQCYDDSDCQAGNYCDKSSTWQQWSCNLKECSNGETSIRSDGYYICENYKFVRKGECAPTDNKCIGNDYYTCSNYNFVNQEATKGQCNVQCKSNSDCLLSPQPSYPYCSVDKKQILQDTFSAECSTSYQCGTAKKAEVVSDCQYGCSNGACQSQTGAIIGETNIVLYLIIGVVVILVIVVVILVIRRLRK